MVEAAECRLPQKVVVDSVPHSVDRGGIDSRESILESIRCEDSLKSCSLEEDYHAVVEEDKVPVHSDTLVEVVLHEKME